MRTRSSRIPGARARRFGATTFWINVRQQVQKQGPAFAWWNLQVYGGAQYSQWIQALDGTVNQPAAFLYPGYSNDSGATPGSILSVLRALKIENPALTGGFLWRYESIAGSGFTTAQFAQAILNGVSTQRQANKGEPSERETATVEPTSTHADALPQ